MYESLKRLLLESVRKTASAVLASRQSEGDFLIEDIQNRMKTMENMLKSIEERKRKFILIIVTGLKQRLNKHWAMRMYEQIYLLHEIALFAEKGDIAEELRDYIVISITFNNSFNLGSDRTKIRLYYTRNAS